MTFRVIRVSSSYDVVLVVSPEDADPKDENAQFFSRNLFVDCEDFKPISRVSALCYFAGIADSMGYGEIPKNYFNSIEEVKEWADKAHQQAMQELEDK